MSAGLAGSTAGNGMCRARGFHAVVLPVLLLVILLASGCATTPEPPPAEPPVPEVQPETPPDRLTLWKSLIAESQWLSEEEKLGLANGFVNRVEFVDDIDHWGREDYWATPRETLLSNGGDCEDFTIAKYFTLLHMQVPVERMRMTYVKATSINQPHMVLSYYAYPEAEPLVLDNLVEIIKPASQRPDLIPVYSFNGNGLWVSGQGSEARPLREASQLRAWREMLERMQLEPDNP